ncbi:hypothetical protein PTKIN_Ptkin17bG0092200 [Pterospermum kingtungense]
MSRPSQTTTIPSNLKLHATYMGKGRCIEGNRKRSSGKSTKAFFEGVETRKKETVLKKEFARHLESSFTTRSQDVTASKLLRANKNKYDLVISDVYMRDMDGFKLLELVGLEMDLPVMMLSASGEACDERSEVAGFDQNGKINKKRNHQNENEECDENGHDNKDPSTQKKPRVAWTHELHYNFVEVVNQLGIDSRTHQLWLDISLKFFASMEYEL